MATFCHQPLTTKTCIRLVILHPGLQADTIRCSLSEIDIGPDREAGGHDESAANGANAIDEGYEEAATAELPEYEALSYTWGPKGTERTILVEGHEVLIRHNLYSFLQRLRRLDSDRAVWVDALSISQIDLAEKAEQVAMIGRTFKQAVSVQVWVGEHADGSERLFRHHHTGPQMSRWSVAAFGLQLRRHRHDLMALSLFVAVMSGLIGVTAGFATHLRYGVATGFAIALLIITSIVIRRSIKPVSVREMFYCHPEWRAFVRRTYFRRTWVVQEVADADSLIVHCGPDSMNWKNLIESRLGIPSSENKEFSRRWMASLMLYSADEHIVLLNALRLKATYVSRDIFQLAYHTRRTDREDQRDHIYALLSTQHYRPGAIRLIPDYQIDVMELCLRLLQDIQLLNVPAVVRGLIITDLVAGLQLSWRQRLRLVGLGVRRGLPLICLDPILFRSVSFSRNFL